MEKNVRKFMVIGAVALSSLACAAPGWFVQTDVNQDFRYRLQTDTQKSYTNNAPRYRERMRYRLGITSKIDDEFSVGARLATGALEDTKSRTDTYGNNNAFGAADINLEQAYLSYSPKWIPGVAGAFKATVGKFGLGTGVYTVTPIVWDTNIALEGKNLNYTYKNLGVQDLTLFANIGSYVLKNETPPTTATGGYQNAYLEIQQLGFQYKFLKDYSADLAYAQYSVPAYDNANYSGIDYSDGKAITEVAVKLGANFSVPGFEKASLVYDEFTNPNMENKDNKATAAGIEFGSKIGLPYLKDYSLKYLDRKIEQNAGWAFYDDAQNVANTKGYQVALTIGLVDNVSFTYDYYTFEALDKGDLTDAQVDGLNRSSTRVELNVKF
jgi:hypothetical protein